MTQAAPPVVRRQSVVEAPIERAFAVFTERFGDFKPSEHNLLGSAIAETVFEPRVGGHIYDRGVDGTQCRWARVLAYEPPTRVVFSWDIGAQGQIETESDNTARSRSDGSPKPPSAPEWSSNTATSTGTARAGRPSATGSPTTRAGCFTLTDTPPCSPAAAEDAEPGPEKRMSVMAMACAERAELADFLDALGPRQWDVPSLCSGWRIRDVVAHVISYEEHGTADLAKRFARARFRPHRLNDVALAEYNQRSPEALVEFLRSHLEPQGATARFSGGVGLVDGLLHHQDIRRPLAMSRIIPIERLLYALPFAVTAPPLRGFWTARGVRLIATDLDWARGKGPEARGTAEAVLMTMAGRREAARELDGPGATILQDRLG